MAGKSSIPPKSALLIVDWQKFFVAPSSKAFVRGSERTAPMIGRVFSLFLSSGAPVLASVHAGDNDPADPFFRFYGKSVGKGDPLASLADPLHAAEGVCVFEKNTYSVFENGHFMRKITGLQIRRFYIAGLQTDKCVLANAFAAFDRGFAVSVLKDCVASRDPVRHSAALDIIGKCCAEVVDSGSLGNEPK